MPDFDSIDPVPRRSFPSPQEVIDDGQRAAPTMHGLMAESLAIEATLRMWAEREPLDDIFGLGPIVLAEYEWVCRLPAHAAFASRDRSSSTSVCSPSALKRTCMPSGARSTRSTKSRT